MQTFSDKVKEDICEAQNGYCGRRFCVNKISSIHHQVKNTKENRQKYKRLIHSVFCGIGLCQYCHANKAHLFVISDKLAQVYEEALNG